MSQNPYAQPNSNYVPYAVPAAQADLVDRLGFIRRTYLHLAGAVIAFVGIETLLLTTFWNQIDARMVFMDQWMWLLVLGVFMVVGWVARSWANSSTSSAIQYLGLGLYVLAQSLIFVPLLWIAARFAPEGTIGTAAVITGVVFAGLTLTVFVTQVDFSFLRMALIVGGLAMLAAFLASALFQVPFSGAVFAGVGVALASGYILYDTSNVLHHYSTRQHVAASLALFASVALLFWYVLQLVMAFSRD